MCIRDRAGVDRRAVQQDGTGAAFALFAAAFRPRHVHLLAQKIDHRNVVLYQLFDILAVELEFYDPFHLRGPPLLSLQRLERLFKGALRVDAHHIHPVFRRGAHVGDRTAFLRGGGARGRHHRGRHEGRRPPPAAEGVHGQDVYKRQRWCR